MDLNIQNKVEGCRCLAGYSWMVLTNLGLSFSRRSVVSLSLPAVAGVTGEGGPPGERCSSQRPAHWRLVRASSADGQIPRLQYLRHAAEPPAARHVVAHGAAKCAKSTTGSSGETVVRRLS